MRELCLPNLVLNAPKQYGNYDKSPDFKGDEYYVVYAEGRKFGDEHERGHQIKTGTTLHERRQIMAGVMALLDGWLEVSPPFQRDIEGPRKTPLALRNYDHMVKPRQNNAKETAAWHTALKTALASSDHPQLHVVVLYRSPEFQVHAEVQLEEALMGLTHEDTPFVKVSYVFLPPTLYAPLDPGELDPQFCWKRSSERPHGFTEKWKKRMRKSYGEKREAWRKFLIEIDWQPHARRLVLIDSTGEKGLCSDQKIKGAIRDACHRKGILSQFIVGNLKIDDRTEKLRPSAAGKLKNAVLDLLLRQQGILSLCIPISRVMRGSASYAVAFTSCGFRPHLRWGKLRCLTQCI